VTFVIISQTEISEIHLLGYFASQYCGVIRITGMNKQASPAQRQLLVSTTQGADVPLLAHMSGIETLGRLVEYNLTLLS